MNTTTPPVIAALQKIRDYESSLTKIDLGAAPDFHIHLNGGVDFHVAGKRYHAGLNRQTIHQLAYRLWGKEAAHFDIARRKWETAMRNSPVAFADDISAALKDNHAICYVHEAERSVYGLVSRHFNEIDALDFRDQFVRDYAVHGAPIEAKKVQFTRNGEVEEVYTFKTLAERKLHEPVRLDLSLIYGRNNGYSSFRFRLRREILRCLNGMTSVEYDNFAQLRHAGNVRVPEFVEQVKEDIFRYSDVFQEKIRESKERRIVPAYHKELMERLHAPKIVKERLGERYRLEAEIAGNSEWALSQSFTNLAAHFYRPNYDKHHERMLKGVGSHIVDYSLEHLLSSEPQQLHYGDWATYGSLLPKDRV